jgi:hypothetical protein
MRSRWLVYLAVTCAAGCSGSKKFAPVSGKVTLNGDPLANATVSFQPIAKEGSIEAGPGSTGTTNDKGEFSLTVATGERGALVGKHRVIISSLNAKSGTEDRRGGPELFDKVPQRYAPGEPNALVFEVPAGGTDKAEFPLTSP